MLDLISGSQVEVSTSSLAVEVTLPELPLLEVSVPGTGSAGPVDIPATWYGFGPPETQDLPDAEPNDAYVDLTTFTLYVLE